MSRTTRTIEDIAARIIVPIDKTAALVTGAGVHYDYDPRVRAAFWSKERPKVTQPLRGAPNIAGRTFGRVIVLGLLAAGSRNGANNRQHNDRDYRIGTGRRSAAWAVRCACGAYDAFKWRALMSGAVTMCSGCEHVEYLKQANP